MTFDYKISLIIPTIGRTNEVKMLLLSIKKFISSDVEIIIIDQNTTDILSSIVFELSEDLVIKHHRVNFKGASAARNYGSLIATGEFLVFPDDDSEYIEDSLIKAYDILLRNNVDILFGRLVDRNGATSFLQFDSDAGFVDISNIIRRSSECTLFIKRKIFEKYKFDEILGVGAFYGSQEGRDLILRLLNDGNKIFYSPDFKMYHPNKIIDRKNINEIKRSYTYSLGDGYCNWKNRELRVYFTRLIKVVSAVCYCVLFRRNEIRYWLGSLCGLVTGYFVRPI